MSLELFLAVVVILILCTLIVKVYTASKRSEFLRMQRKHSVSLEIIVSRHNESHVKDVEDLYQTIASMYKKHSMLGTIQGKEQLVTSFEIFATKGSIKFFIKIDKGVLQNAVINVLKGKYPDIEVNIVADPMSIFLRRKDLYVSKARYALPDIFALKGYKDIDGTKEGTFTDPLSPLMSAYSTLGEGEVAYMGMHVSPLGGKGKKLLQRIQKLFTAGYLSSFGEKQGALLSRYARHSWWARVLLRPGAVFATVSSQETPAGTTKVAPSLKEEGSLLEVTLDIAYAGKRTKYLDELAASFTTLAATGGNGLRFSPIKTDRAGAQLLKRATSTIGMIMSTEEVSMIWHPPTSKLESPFIAYSDSALDMYKEGKDLIEGGEQTALEEQSLLQENATSIGIIEHFGKKQVFSIDEMDRRRHVYIIGQTGTGKSTLQEQMILSNIYRGHGVAVVDPHGEMVEKILHYIPKHRKNDVAYFDPSDTENPPAFNILNVEGQAKDLMATELLGVFQKMFENSWGPRMEQILYNTLAALVDTPNATLVDIPAFITTRTFREQCLKHCTDIHVIAFWHDQFDVLDPRVQRESVVAVLNKVEKFLNNKIIRGVFASKRNRFNFDFIMNKQKILLVNLSKGKISPINSEIIGSMIVSRLLIDAMKRVHLPEAERKDFYLYIDEFQNFVSSVKTFESILSEARKYRLNLTMAHQYMKQLPEELRSAIFGNVGTIMSFRVGLEDADMLVKQFGENNVSRENLTTLAPFSLYSRSVKNNKITTPVKVKTLPPVDNRFEKLPEESVESLVAFSRKQYSWNAADKASFDNKAKMLEAVKEKEYQKKAKKKKS